MKKQIVVLNGIHGSGKTTLGLAIAKRLGALYLFEIGGERRKQSTDNAMQSRDEFDQLIMDKELERDIEILANPSLVVVETWHSGNLAYAKTRSPDVYQRYCDAFAGQLELFDPLHVLCTIDEQTFYKRATEKVLPEDLPNLYAFYLRILAETLDLYRRLNLRFIEINNAQPLELSVAKAMRLLGEHL